MPASIPSPYQALYWFNCSPLLLLPGSLARIAHHRENLFLIKMLWKRGKSRRGRSLWSDLCIGLWQMTSHIINARDWQRPIGAAKYLIVPSIAHCGWFTLSIPETNQWATGCSLSLRDGKTKKNTQKTSVGPSNARLPIQPCVECLESTLEWMKIS